MNYRVIAANKSALKKLAESEHIKDIETLKMISPLDFNGVDAALVFLDENRKLWEKRCIPYVVIRDVDSLKTPKLQELRNRIAKEEKTYNEAVKKADVKNFKARLITCSCCESKVNKVYIEDSKCPVCGTDLRAKSVVEAIQAKGLKLKRARLQYNNEKSKKKYIKEAPLRYLVYVGEKK